MFASSGSAQLAYDSTGAEGGVDVSLVHAGVNDRRSWHHVVKRLGSRHRCVVFDMRGFGDTATAELNARIEAADSAGEVDEVTRLEAWMWLDGPAAEEGRVGGPARDLFLDMNRRALQAKDPGEQAELPAAWPRLGEIAVPTLMMIGRLDAEHIQTIDEPAAGMILNAQLTFLDGVAHVPHLEATRRRSLRSSASSTRSP